MGELGTKICSCCYVNLLFSLSSLVAFIFSRHSDGEIKCALKRGERRGKIAPPTVGRKRPRPVPFRVFPFSLSLFFPPPSLPRPTFSPLSPSLPPILFFPQLRSSACMVERSLHVFLRSAVVASPSPPSPKPYFSRFLEGRGREGGRESTESFSFGCCLLLFLAAVFIVRSILP